MTLELDDVKAAARRLAGVAHRTPLLTSRTLDAWTGGRVYLKAECLQRGGSFKVRGAYNRMALVPPEARANGVVAFSSGNHAQAVALVAGLLGMTATIVMPADTPAVKMEATRGHGAGIVTYDRYTEDREAIAEQLATSSGATLVRPFDDPLVMAGQGTAALELIADAGELDALLVPVGGGGLIAGCATVAKALLPRARVVGVEPAAGDDTKRSFEAGERVRIPVPDTIADALRSTTPGALTFPVNRRRVDEIVLVTDDEIREAMAFCWDHLELVVEPAGATGVAALLAGKLDITSRRAGVVVSGGNVDVARLSPPRA